MTNSTTTQETNKARSRNTTHRSFRLQTSHTPATADDSGFTPAEIIIGVILVAILATGVTVKAVQLMGRARDSAAKTTLRTAVAAAQAVYANMLPGGYNNYSGKVPVKSGATIGQILTPIAAAVTALNIEEPGANFESYADYTATNLADTPPKPQAIWVETIEGAKEIKAGSTALSFAGRANPNESGNSIADIPASLTVTAGDLIRMGVIAASGNSFCVILIGNDSHNRITGEGWQAVDEANTQAGRGADCGAEVTGDAVFREMPDTPGTDPKISATVSNLTTGANGQAYSSS